MLSAPITEKKLSRGMLDVLIRAGLIVILAVSCFRIFYPFANLMVWSLILAVALYPLHLRLRKHLGNKDGLTATLLVVISLLVITIPTYLLGVALVDSIEHGIEIVKGGSLRIPAPSESVASWPLIGGKVYAFWQQASTDLTGLLQTFMPHLKGVATGLLDAATGVGAGLLIFFFALIISGIFMAYGEESRHSAEQIASRIFGAESGPKITDLCSATIRAVAQGVVGIAFIQMLLVGIGFVAKGIPGAGLLALAVLLLGIMQLPATLITIPVIIFVFATEGFTVGGVVFAVYVFVAGLADNVLKPLLLGRGVDVPMPVVLIGALGGMVTGGVIGLFIGPVVLAVGYQLFWRWVEDQPHAEAPPVEPKQP
ncbi:AI-2E family transporter [Dyella solisilvae]|uniref:AI-2E family transporter n=1 Tax=Dyella solisilvae TaxID=1920168 RepID=A0A370K482_9GAMM|nr:AI-2E family transporter [Dyella solisilvae]RDI97471.1 AI-2E family transporter [Dyella solisilvae]